MEKQTQPTHLPRRKRSARLSLAMMGASAFGLTACTQPAEDEHLTDVRFDEPKSYPTCTPAAPAKTLTRPL